MSDGLTTVATPEPLESAPEPPGHPAWLVAGLQGLLIVVVFAGVGALCGWLWFHLWDAPKGVVSAGQWYTGEAGLRADFAGVAWYVSLSVLAGLVLGALAAWLLHRSELVTLAAVLIGSVLAAYLMLRVGTHLSPPDPHVLAKTTADGTELEGALRVRGWPPRGAFTFGALVGLAVVYAVSVSRTPADLPAEPAPPAPERPDAPPQG
jgi:hypothetical protein